MKHMTPHANFSDLKLKDNQFKKLALASAILLVTVLAILILELPGIRR